MFAFHEFIEELTLPLTIKEIPQRFADQAIRFCVLNNTDNIEIIGRAAFQSSGIKSIYSPKCNTLLSYCFNNCKNLNEITLGNKINLFPQACFGGCILLKKINGILHFLVQAKLECGNLDVFELAPTVQCLTGNIFKGDKKVVR